MVARSFGSPEMEFRGVVVWSVSQAASAGERRPVIPVRATPE